LAYLLIFQIVEIYFKNNLPSEIKSKLKFNTDDTFDEIVKFLCNGWFQTFLTCQWMINNEIYRVNVLKKPLEEFKMQLKDIHYEHQNNKDLHQFWFNVVSKISFFISLFIQSHFYGDNYSRFGDFEIPIKNILNDLYLLSYKQTSEFNLSEIKLHIKEFLKLCYIEVDEKSPLGVKYKEGTFIKIPKNPKLLFRGEVIHTEKSIVAFIDILGFKNHINEYDSNPESDILQRLHNALQVSIESIKLSKNIDPLHKKILDYQMFSDCICLSIPIYDTNDDFLSEFASMVLIIATYQYMMLINGFYIRGGISIGSHFSDKSMIFSGGLVKSYFLESKQAINPIIILDKEIVNKLKLLKTEFKKVLNIEHILIFEQTSYNKVFINPFSIISLLSKSKESLKNILSNIIFDDKIESFISTILSFSSEKFDTLLSKEIISNIEKQALTSIKQQTEKNILNYKDKQDISQKYIWFKALIEWYEFNNIIFKKFLDES
jgi:hypothetical protein